MNLYTVVSSSPGYICDHGLQKNSLKLLGYICSNSQIYIVWVKIIDFSFIPKIIRTLSKDPSMKIFSKFPTVNIYIYI